jgi:acetyltransferase-like isoleucine patch superfamily enzyme
MSKNIFFNKEDLKFLGDKVILGQTVRIRHPENASIDSGSIIDDFTYISASIEVKKFVHIASSCTISGGEGKFSIGNFSTLATHVSTHCGSTDYRSLTLDHPAVPKESTFGGEKGDISIGDFCVIGAHSCILPGVEIPDGVAFGAYSLIKKKEYKPYHLYAGLKCIDMGKRDLKYMEEINKVKKKYNIK